MLKNTLIRRLGRLVLAAGLVAPALGAVALVRPAPVYAAYTTCYVYTWIPWITGGVEAHGGGTINCDSPDPVSDEIRSILKENFGFITFDRDEDWVYASTYSPLSVVTEYWCDTHGTDDWWTRSRGRDGNGNYSYWYNSLVYSLTC